MKYDMTFRQLIKFAEKEVSKNLNEFYEKEKNTTKPEFKRIYHSIYQKWYDIGKELNVLSYSLGGALDDKISKHIIYYSPTIYH